ncbi:MAG: urocanate hydratase [Patescibacteria group bacterium]|nr:urocanate hydratase [Patescibacteria group bacterium]
MGEADRVKLITGTERTCASWGIEGALRMLYNNVVQGADPDRLIIYGGRGKAARNWPSFWKIDEALRRLKPDETLLVQSGKPVGILRTFEGAPRVLIVNSMLVPQWCTDAEFWPLEARELIMYGQMTAGSWAYIDQQGIMQATFETFAAAGAGSGTLIVSGGLGSMGGAQAPAGKMTGATILIAEINPARIQRCRREGWVDEVFGNIPQAVQRAFQAKAEGLAIAIAVQANAVDLLEYLLNHDQVPNFLTDQTSAHDPVCYCPQGLSFIELNRLRQEDEAEYRRRSLRTITRHVEVMVLLMRKGATTFEYGNGMRLWAKGEGLDCAFEFQGFVPLYVRPLFCQGRGPFRVAALSGNPADIAVVDEIILSLFPDNERLVNWIRKAQKQIDFSRLRGLPARVCWLGMGERYRAVEQIFAAIHAGDISAPIWVGRDHLDCGSVASPSRETEGMLDGSDAIADWPILNALLATAGGADWVSVHQGGGVGIGKSIHAGQCFVIEPTQECLDRAMRVFTNDPAIGLIRHADSGEPEAIANVRKHRIDMPMLPPE